MKTNVLNRLVPDGCKPFQGAKTYRSMTHQVMPEVKTTNTNKVIHDIGKLFDRLDIQDGMTLSFHHHLREGDAVLNMVLAEIKTRKLQNLTLAPSAIFPVHAPLAGLIESGQVTTLYTNYLNGPVSDVVTAGKLKGLLVMDTHGGRPRAIESGELKIDIAFIAVPACDKHGNGNGIEGPNACGVLGYPICDMRHARIKVAVTDHLTDAIKNGEIVSDYIDHVLVVDKIGDARHIVSGTTRPTHDPVQLKIASNTIRLIESLGMIKEGMSFQTGAGGTSLAVAQHLKQRMIALGVKGSFASGGITGFLVDMLENGLFERLHDVQCFDLKAVESYRNNARHLFMDASAYANPHHPDPVVNGLDIVILGATEVDLDFNVNVTTDSYHNIIGGSGGHADTAYGAKLAIITTNLVKTRIPIITDKVTTITTPGESIDAIVTERGIAIHPKRTDLIDKLKGSSLPIMTIEALRQKALSITGTPEPVKHSDDVVGIVRYRDGTIIDCLYRKEEHAR